MDNMTLLKYKLHLIGQLIRAETYNPNSSILTVEKEEKLLKEV